MANFTAKDVNELRKNTGVGMMDCKKALTEADGDVEKAMLILRDTGKEGWQSCSRRYGYCKGKCRSHRWLRRRSKL